MVEERRCCGFEVGLVRDAMIVDNVCRDRVVSRSIADTVRNDSLKLGISKTVVCCKQKLKNSDERSERITLFCLG